MFSGERRWEARSGQVLEERAHDREEIRAAIETMRTGGHALNRIPERGDSWLPERSGGRGGALPTTLVRQLVAEGYAQVTNAGEWPERGEDGVISKWVRVPRRVYWTGKGLERR